MGTGPTRKRRHLLRAADEITTVPKLGLAPGQRRRSGAKRRKRRGRGILLGAWAGPAPRLLAPTEIPAAGYVEQCHDHRTPGGGRAPGIACPDTPAVWQVRTGFLFFWHGSYFIS